MLEPFTLDDAAIALQFVSPDMDRNNWISMAGALKHEFGDMAFDTFDSWSSGGASYKENDTKTAWKSVKVSGSSKTATIGSLIHLAKEGGYVPHKREYSDEEKKQFAIKQEEQKKRRAAQAEQDELALVRQRLRAKKITAEVWAMASIFVAGPYLQDKKVKPYGLRMLSESLVILYRGDDEHELYRGSGTNHFFNEVRTEQSHFHFYKKNTLLVPLYNAKRERVNLQFINAQGSKKFLKGGQKKDCFHVVGDVNKSEFVALAEGYATAATIHEAMGWPVLVAFDAGNLRSVAEAFNGVYPDKKLIICGDDDIDTEGNPGRTKAEATANAVNGFAFFPNFDEEV